MSPEQKAAFINSQVACALIEMEGMKALNIEREQHGHALAYDEDAFLALLDKYSVSHNAVLKYFQESEAQE